MTTLTGTVTAVSTDSATITFDPRIGCSACATGTGCGLGPVLGLFVRDRGRSVEVPLHRDAPVQVGERLHFVFSTGRLAALAAAAYGLPLIATICGAGLAVAIAPAGGDLVAVIGAGAGVALAGLWLRLGGIGRAVQGTLRAGLVETR